MKVKIDTKEKFHVITIEQDNLDANMTENLKQTMLPFLNNTNKNLIVNLENIEQIDVIASQVLFSIQQTFYDQNCSLVFCNIQQEVETFLDENELLEVMNTTPTESEAWDIVQMEEIEREFSDE